MAVALRFEGMVGGDASLVGPSRLVPNAASSTMTSQVPVAVSPICRTPMPATVPRSTVLEVSSVTGVPSSQTSTLLLAPLTSRWSSRTCHPVTGTTELVVPVGCASLRKPSFPPEVR